MNTNTVIQEREELQSNLEVQFYSLQKDIERLEAQSSGRKEYEEEIAAIRQREQELQQRLHELRHANDEAWHTFRVSAEQAWNDLTRDVGELLIKVK